LLEGVAAPLLLGVAAVDEGRTLLELELVGADVPEELELAAGGVNGTVTPRPGSSVVGTLAAKAVKVLLPVVGGLIAPYMPLLQCGGRPQKNQIGVLGSETCNEYTPTWAEVALKGMKPELNPFLLVAVLNCHAHGLAKLL